jgi:mRNA interferase MazF
MKDTNRLMTRRIRRGDIFSVDFEPIRGSEQGKIRPALVIQNDVGNRHSPTIIVAPITSGEKAKFRVNVAIKVPEGGLTNNSIILLNQIRTTDRSRFGRYWGQVTLGTMRKVDEAIKISLGLDPI